MICFQLFLEFCKIYVLNDNKHMIEAVLLQTLLLHTGAVDGQESLDVHSVKISIIIKFQLNLMLSPHCRQFVRTAFVYILLPFLLLY